MNDCDNNTTIDLDKGDVMESKIDEILEKATGKIGIHEIHAILMAHNILVRPKMIEDYLAKQGYFIHKDACGCGGGNYIEL